MNVNSNPVSDPQGMRHVDCSSPHGCAGFVPDTTAKAKGKAKASKSKAKGKANPRTLARRLVGGIAKAKASKSKATPTA